MKTITINYHFPENYDPTFSDVVERPGGKL